MRHVTETVVVQACAGHLFTHVAACWEARRVLGSEDSEYEAVRPAPTDRMGDGFTVLCPASRWGLPVDAELTVMGFRPPMGWRAESGEPPVVWQTEFSTAPGNRTRLTCRIDYQPRGPAARFRELVRGRRRRAGTLRRLLSRWREDAERQEALCRLRAATGHVRPQAAESEDRTH